MPTLLMRHAWLVTLLCCIAAAPATTQMADAPQTAPSTERPKIYRMRAGVPGEDGWCAAKSTGGNFTVSLPARFNDVTVTKHEDDGTTLRTHMVAVTLPDGTRIAASASSNAKVDLPADAAARYADMLATAGVPRNRRAARMDGVDAMEIDVVSSTAVSRYRVAQRDDTIYLLTIQRDGRELPDDTVEMAARFFDSFRFPAAASDAEPNDAPLAR